MRRNSLRWAVGLAFAAFSGAAFAQEAVTLAERFDPAEPYQVKLEVNLTGRLAIPTEKGKPPQVLPMVGASRLLYDERVLPADDPGAGKAVRIYREVSIARTVGDKEQQADIRPAVRRMVVLRSDRGKKAPFSPDGPLTWGEIDVVRTDVFSPALVNGLLPGRRVAPGQSWQVSGAAVTELTDLDPIDDGGLTAEFVSVVVLHNRRYAKLVVKGAVKGVSEDGPSRQRLDGTGYFDLDAGRLTYLNLAGRQELLGPDGKTVGEVKGAFVMTRGPAGRTADLSDAALAGVDLRPSDANTELLYDNPDLGLRFQYPRRWRVGTAQGRQVTLDEARGGGILFGVEPAQGAPTADQFLAETRDYLRERKWAVLAADPPRRAADGPARVDRFGFDAEVNGERVRLEYAVVATADGGVTVAARLPWADRDALGRDVDRVVRTVAVTKRIEK